MADTPTPPPPPAAAAGSADKPLWKRWWFIAGAVIVVIAILGAIGGGAEEGDTAAEAVDTSAVEQPDDEANEPDDTTPETAEPVGEEPAEETTTTTTAPAASEADDITGCTLIDGETVEITGTNNSSKQSSYLLSIVFSAGGTRTADEPFFINYVRPGESFVERSFGFSAEGADACEVVEVDRNAAESPDDVSEVACELTGTDVLGDIQGRVVATNSSSQTSDYSIEVALVRDGVRIGTGSAFTENVQPGESAPADLFTVVDGPADGVTCDVVHVSRSASS